MKSEDPVDLVKSEKLFTTAFEHAAIGMGIVSLDGRWLLVNSALSMLLGYSEEELLTMTFQEITYPEDLQIDQLYLQDLILGKRQSYQKEKRYYHKRGSIIYALLSVTLVRDNEGNPHFLISQIQDITKHKELENDLMKQAKEDPLTGACNRRCFFELSDRELSRGGRYEEPSVLLMIDIDHFKRVNDTYGHDAGDKVLQVMTKTCQEQLRTFDVYGRIGGEEFAVLLVKTDIELGKKVAERLRRAVESLEVLCDNNVLRITISIGGVGFVGGTSPLEKLMKLADDALYEAKNSGRNRVRIKEDLSCQQNALKRKDGFVQLEWHEEYRCGHELIDRQHRHLFKAANKLLSSLASSYENDIISLYVAQLMHDVKEHFSTEEQIMREVGFPLVEHHVKVHKALMKKAESLSRRLLDEQLEVSEVLQFLAIDVVYYHLLREDRKFYSYIP